MGIFIDLIASDVKTELFTASLQTWATFERPKKHSRIRGEDDLRESLDLDCLKHLNYTG